MELRDTPAEAAFHDAEKNDKHELFFMCDDLAATLLSASSPSPSSHSRSRPLSTAAAMA